MKLKKLFVSLAVSAFAAVMLGSVSAFAEEASFKVGTPIDITGENKYFAFPIDIETNTNTVNGGVIEINCDTSVMSVGINAGSTFANQKLKPKFFSDNKGKAIFEQNGSNYDFYFVHRIGTYSEVDEMFSPYQMQYKHDKAATNFDFTVAWADDNGIQLEDDKAELYLLVTVNDEFFNKLNDNTLITISPNSKVSVSKDLTTTSSVEKANACAGAFQVVIDTSKASNSWIQELYVKDNNNKYPIQFYVEDGSKVIFPVRVDSTSTADKQITVYATTTPDEAGSGAETEVELGKITLKLDGSVTSYDQNSVTK